MSDVTEVELETLQERARSCADERARRTPEPAPVVIEFSGSPKSGKSTTIDVLQHFFKRMHFKVWAPTEGASKRSPYHLKQDLVAFNAWNLSYALSELLTAYNSVDRQDLIILDRGPFDSVAWMGLLRDQGTLSNDDYEVIKRFALLPKWSAVISRLYLFTCDPNISLERETKMKLTTAPGSAMNDDVLASLLDRYGQVRDELGSYPVHHVDTTKTTNPLRTSYDIAEDVLNLLEGGA